MCDSSVACPRSCGQSLHRGPAVPSALYGGAPGASPQGTHRSTAPTGASEVSRFSCRKFLGVHWGLRLRKTAPELALSFRCMLPSAQVQRRQRLDWGFSKFDTQPTYSPVYASCRSSWSVTQNSGPSGSLIFTRKDSSSSASYRLSGKAMARTGLRMMPTFPLPPLKFRTAGFPRYGFKVGLSNGAFPS